MCVYSYYGLEKKENEIKNENPMPKRNGNSVTEESETIHGVRMKVMAC